MQSGDELDGPVRQGPRQRPRRLPGRPDGNVFGLFGNVDGHGEDVSGDLADSRIARRPTDEQQTAGFQALRLHRVESVCQTAQHAFDESAGVGRRRAVRCARPVPA